MMAARGKDASLNIASHHTSNGNIQRLSAHMLAYSDELALSYFLFDLFSWPSEPAFLYCCSSHCGRKMCEIEIANIAFVSLEVGVVSEELVELISTGLALK